jgi:hypothetical protein
MNAHQVALDGVLDQFGVAFGAHYATVLAVAGGTCLMQMAANSSAVKLSVRRC